MPMRGLRIGFFNRLSLLRCRSSIDQRPIHRWFAPTTTSSHRRELSDSQAAAAAEVPSWVMLHCGYGFRMDDSIVADPNTFAESRTSTGQHLRVCFGRALPPASSFVYYDWPGSAPGGELDHHEINVIAANGDSALLETRDRQRPDAHHENNYFVYWVGAARPPSLTLLLAGDFQMHERNTGLLRRGDGELLVVQHEPKHRYCREGRDMEAESEFCVHRLGTSEWELRQTVPIFDGVDNQSYDYGIKGWATFASIPVGDRFLCWVQSDSHFLLSDMADEASPKVRYVPLPPDMSRCWIDDEEDEDYPPTKKKFYSKSLGAVGGSHVRFVRVERHCCCGGPGRSTCARSRCAFTLNTWTMNLSMEEPLTWVKDAAIDCEEIWALPGYEGLPRAYLECPVVSLDNPDIVCFSVDNHYQLRSFKDFTLWKVQLNIRTKTLLSVIKYTNDSWRASHHLPAKLQC